MFTRTLIWIWMFSLLVSTVGVSLHAVYCFCAGKSTVSFFEAVDYCTEKQEMAMMECCMLRHAVTNVPDYASGTISGSAQHPKHEKKAETCCERPVKERDCTQTTTTVFVLKTDLNLEKNTLKVIDFQFIPEPVNFVTPPFPIGVLLASTSLNKAPPESPPALSGREICLQGGVFLC